MAGTYPDSRVPRARSARQQFWLEHLRAWQVQGTSLRAYAAANGLSSSSLYRARRRLERRGLLSAREEAAPAFVPVRVRGPTRALRRVTRARRASHALMHYCVGNDHERRSLAPWMARSGPFRGSGRSENEPIPRVRARFVQKCTVRDSPLMATDHPPFRAKAQSLPATRFWRRHGLQRLLVALQGPSWPNTRGCADQRQPGSDRRRRARRRCCSGKTNVFFRHSSDVERQHQNCCVFRTLHRSTKTEARPLPCISARILLVP